MLHKYQIKIVMPDGSSALAWGPYASAWDAIDCAMTSFSGAKWITARRLS